MFLDSAVLKKAPTNGTDPQEIDFSATVGLVCDRLASGEGARWSAVLLNA